MTSRQLTTSNDRLWIAYSRDCRIRNLSPATISGYFEAVYNADRFFQRDLSAVTKLDIREYLAARLEALAARSVVTYYRSLRTFYNWLVAEEVIEKSPMTGVSQPAFPDEPPAVLSDEDLKSLLRACQGKTLLHRRDEAIIRVMSEPGGPRLAEIAGLTVDAVDDRNDIIVVTGKTGTRYIPFGNKTGTALDRYRRIRETHRDSERSELWLGIHGPLTGNGIAQMLEVRAKLAGIGHVHPHQLRHTAAHRWLASGGSETDALQLFGWSTTDMLRVYGRSSAAARAHASARRQSLGDRL